MRDPKRKATLSALDRIFDDATAAPLGDRLGDRRPSLVITIGGPATGGGSSRHEREDDEDDDELV